MYLKNVPVLINAVINKLSRSLLNLLVTAFCNGGDKDATSFVARDYDVTTRFSIVQWTLACSAKRYQIFSLKIKTCSVETF